MAHILLVEPDRLLADTYARALENSAHTVTAAGTAQAAIMQADLERPDVVVLELQLVEHSGIEFLYEFRSYPEWQSVPVIVQTQVPPAEFTNHQQILRQQLGVTQYLYKPQTNLKKLLRALNEALIHA
jgi:two-component system, OmpR family, phosphate regulon response regulator PhoB